MSGDGSDGVLGKALKFLISEAWTDGSFMTLKSDVISGITLAVTQVAPSVAFALMAGGFPLSGLFSSFFLGSLSCAFGGRPGQITAIAGALVVLYPTLVLKHGYDFVCVVGIITGVLHCLLGLLRISQYITLLPATVMIGFCNGLAISMVMHQISSFQDEHGNYPIGADAIYAAILCVITYCVMMLMPLFTKILPSTFVAIIIGTALDYAFQLDTTTIGDLYELQGAFPAPKLPNVPWSSGEFWSDVLVSSLLTFVVAAVESFMSDYKIQQLTETITNFDREAWALGIGLIVNGFFQGIPGCVVFGPCILNIESGTGTRRTASFICAVLMGIVPLALYPIIKLLPMPVLAAVVFGVSSKTADWRMLAMIFLQRISFQEAAVALAVTIVTCFTNLAIATASGFGVALLCFMWNMSRGRVTMMPHMDQMISLDMPQPYNYQPPPSPGEEDPASENVPSDKPERGVINQRVVSFALPVPSTKEDEADPGVKKDAERAQVAELDLSLEERCPVSPVGGSDVFSDRDEREHESSASFHQDGGSRNVSLSCSIRIEVPNTSMAGRNFVMDLDFLNIEEDTVFPQIKVLRVKLCGVLFFGSCTDFVDNMMKLLHSYHSQLFLRVTDFILDFQNGLMPVMDFSAAEALEISALTLQKRGIRVHLQNMDPLSEVCVDRARRYFPHLLDDNTDNNKNICYARRVFNRGTAHRRQNDDVLDDNVFTTVETEATRTLPSGAIRAEEEVLSFEETIKVGFPVYLSEFGITVPVFDTLGGWRERVRQEKESGVPSILTKGLTNAEPFDRRYGDIGKVWWMRLRNHDVKRLKKNATKRATFCDRPVPTKFLQVPRFPGQGYSKREVFSREEWCSIQRNVLKLWDVDDPREPLNCCSARMIGAVNTFIDGFV